MNKIKKINKNDNVSVCVSNIIDNDISTIISYIDNMGGNKIFMKINDYNMSCINLKNIGYNCTSKNVKLCVSLDVMDLRYWFRICKESFVDEIVLSNIKQHIDNDIEEFIMKCKMQNICIGLELDNRIGLSQIARFVSTIGFVLISSCDNNGNFDYNVLDKVIEIHDVKKIKNKLNIVLIGGINYSNIYQIVHSNVNSVIIESNQFTSININETVKDLNVYMKYSHRGYDWQRKPYHSNTFYKNINILTKINDVLSSKQAVSDMYRVKNISDLFSVNNTTSVLIEYSGKYSQDYSNISIYINKRYNILLNMLCNKKYNININHLPISLLFNSNICETDVGILDRYDEDNGVIASLFDLDTDIFYGKHFLLHEYELAFKRDEYLLSSDFMIVDEKNMNINGAVINFCKDIKIVIYLTITINTNTTELLNILKLLERNNIILLFSIKETDIIHVDNIIKLVLQNHFNVIMCCDPISKNERYEGVINIDYVVNTISLFMKTCFNNGVVPRQLMLNYGINTGDILDQLLNKNRLSEQQLTQIINKLEYNLFNSN